MNLTRVNPDEEVQGEIHLSLELLKVTEKIDLFNRVETIYNTRHKT